jgi:hypothetical protein
MSEVKFSLAQLAKEEEARKSGRSKNPYTAGRTEKELEKDRAEQDKARKAVSNKPYINPFFAEKEMFKTRDNSLRANPKSPFTLMKPLRPNILDAAADERQKELAEQRKKAGHKWVVVTQR